MNQWGGSLSFTVTSHSYATHRVLRVKRFSNAAGQPAKLGTELGKQEAPDMGDSSL